MKAVRLLIVLALVIFVVLPVVMAQDGSEDEGKKGNVTAEALALLIAGLVAPKLTQILKRLFGGLEARPALWVAFGTSVLVALLAYVLTGVAGWTAPPADPAEAIVWFAKIAGMVYGLATLVYKTFMSKPKLDN